MNLVVLAFIRSASNSNGTSRLGKNISATLETLYKIGNIKGSISIKFMISQKQEWGLDGNF